ncbi:MAG TPA: hypothetical protein VMX17_08220 [Candidatus Glassbacteria bacterium]|nr:hypothetical protein [Candidatus Glassbacteria bacterium]
MKATVNTQNGSKTVNIQAADVVFSEKELERMERKFNKDTRVIEFVGGVTYCINYVDKKGKFRSQRLKSSSLDELMEMYKCAWKGKDIPERKCFFHK